MIIEIVYDYRVDVKSPPLMSWTYFYVNTEVKEKAITKAKSYFKKFCTEHAWTGKAKIVEVDVIGKHDSLPTFITVPEPELPPKKRDATNTKRTRASVRQSKGAPASEKPKVRGLSDKPGKGNESSKSSRTDSSKNRRQTKPSKARGRTTGTR